MKKIYLTAITLILSTFLAMPAFAADRAAKGVTGKKTPTTSATKEAAGKKPTQTRETKDPARILAIVVNDHEISLEELLKEMKKQARQITLGKGGKTPEQKSEQIEKAAIDSLVFQELARQYGRKNFKIKAAEIDAKIKDLRENLKTDEAFGNFLIRNNYTEGLLRREIEKRLLINRAFKQEVDAKIKFDEKKARKEYEAKPKIFTIPARIEVDDLFIATGKDKKAAAGKAAGLRAKLMEYKSTEKLTDDDKMDCRVRTITLFEDKDADLFEKIAALEPGGVSEAVEHDGGYHVMLVLDKKAPELIPFDKAKKWFKSRARNKRTREWFKELKKDATIKIMKNKTTEPKVDKGGGD